MDTRPHLTKAAWFALSVATACGASAVHASILDTISAMPANSWLQANNNLFSDAWTPPEHRLPSARSLGWGDRQYAIIGAWSGFGWDSQRSSLIIYGGGHANYGGNDVYSWNANTQLWARASLPSRIQADANGEFFTVDGPMHAPISAHTYDNDLYLKVSDRYITFGGAAWGSGPYIKPVGSGYVRTGPYLFDLAKADGNKVGGLSGSGVDPTIAGGQMWENRDAVSGSVRLKSFNSGVSGYAIENGKDVVYVQARAGGTRGELYRYTINDPNDSTFDTWEKVGKNVSTTSPQGSGTYAPDFNLFMRTGTSADPFMLWDLSQAGSTNGEVWLRPTDLTNGRFSYADITRMGLDYDPLNQRFLIWGGGTDVYALTHDDSSPWSTGWTLSLLNEGDATGPGVNEYGRGILGKWQYAAELGVFVGLKNPTDGEVWFYKPGEATEALPAYVTDLPLNTGDFRLNVADASVFASDLTAPAAVPEPSLVAMLVAGLPLLWWTSCRSRRLAA
ncbi:MAG: hypothetical protein ACLGGY_00210 [Gammaproteobacteria bacterium]